MAFLLVEAELSAQLGLARSLLAGSPLPMSVLDTGNRYLDVNRAWEQFTGRQRGFSVWRATGEGGSPHRAEKLAAASQTSAATG